MKDEYVSAYSWDYGDGSEGIGKQSNHSYQRPGLYNVTLTAKDINGGTDSRSTVAYAHTVELSVDVDTAPSGQKYNYGDSQESLQVNVSYPDNRKFESMQIYGELSGSKNVNTSFKKNPDGAFVATVDYPIMKEDGLFLDVYVNATDRFYNSGTDFERLLVASSDPGLDIMVERPVSRLFAPGQLLRFAVKLTGPEGWLADISNLTLYESWTKNSYPLGQEGDAYCLAYRMPVDAKPKVHLYVYGNGSSGSKEFHAYKDLEISVSRKLGLALAYPTPADQSQGLDMIKLNVTYPDGEPFEGGSLNALVDNSSVVLEKRDGLFYGSYNFRREKPDLYVKVWDVYGNVGESVFTVFDDRVLNGLELGALIVMALFFLAALFFGFTGSSFYSRRKKPRDALRKEYDELDENIVALKKLMEDIKKEYYTRKISAEDAQRRLLDYQEELNIETSKIRSVLENMGLDKKDVEGHEELIRWLVEKLEAKENKEKIKRVIVDSGVDTGIVERVKRVFAVH